MDIQAFKSSCPMGKTGKVSLRVLMVYCVNGCLESLAKSKNGKVVSLKVDQRFLVIKGNVN